MLEAVRAARSRCSLAQFVRNAWHTVTPGVEYQHNWHIDAICSHLEAVSYGEIRRLVINMPPRFGKSTIVSVMWPAWTWAQEPSVRWLFSSYSQTLSTRDSMLCRKVIESNWYQDCWGSAFELTTDHNLKTEFMNNAGGYRTATSVGGSATGKGGDIVVVDDPHSLDDAYHDSARDNAVRWWRTTMSTRTNDPQNSARVVVAQRIHNADLSAWCLKNDYDLLCLRMRARSGEAKNEVYEDPRKPGELLWPDRYGEEQVQEQRTDLGKYAAAAQQEQDPVPQGGSIIQISWTNQRWQVLPAEASDWMLSWDCTFKDLATSDFVVGQVWCRHGAKRFLVDQVRRRMDIVATLAAIADMSSAYPQATRVMVEDKANGTAVMALLKHAIPGLIPFEPHGSKASRLYACSPLFEAGNVYIPQSAPWVADYVTELTHFPSTQNDDMVDATTQALLTYEADRHRPGFAFV